MPKVARLVEARTIDLSLTDQRALLTWLGQTWSVEGGWVKRLADQLRANLAPEEAEPLPRRLTQFDDQPVPGSVVMTQGLGGTAWQRRYDSGLWSSVTSGLASWEELLQFEGGAGMWLVLVGQPRP